MNGEDKELKYMWHCLLRHLRSLTLRRPRIFQQIFFMNLHWFYPLNSTQNSSVLKKQSKLFLQIKSRKQNETFVKVATQFCIPAGFKREKLGQYQKETYRFQIDFF